MKFDRCALASYPRSGNTWMRHLIFEATGLRSGYIRNPETGEVHHAGAIPQIEDTDSPLIKTHDKDADNYSAAIHIVRNPWNAIASYLDYCHTFAVPIQRREWFIDREAEGWAEHAEYWRMAHQSGAIEAYHPVRYEDLLFDAPGELWKVIKFLGLESTEDKIIAAVEKCTLPAMQAKGTSDFYKLGFARNFADTLTRDEINRIAQTVEAELSHWIYR